MEERLGSYIGCLSVFIHPLQEYLKANMNKNSHAHNNGHILHITFFLYSVKIHLHNLIRSGNYI